MKEIFPLPSNRSFATVFVVVFLLVAAWQGWEGATGWAWAWFSAATLTALTALLRPALLTPFNHAWMHFGLFLNRIVSPIVLGLMYAVLIIPAGLIMRVLGRDVMQRRFKDGGSYWQPREDGEMTPERFNNQF